MKIRIKAIIGLMLIFAMMFAFCVQSFAAWKTINGRASDYLMTTKTCKFTNLGTDKVTVVNNGKTNMYVYINGCFWREISPGRECTYATYSNKITVKVYAVNTRALGTQKFIIKTTSGSIY